MRTIETTPATHIMAPTQFVEVGDGRIAYRRFRAAAGARPHATPEEA